MSGRVWVLLLLFLAAPSYTVAAELHPGDQVRLIEREQHIPAHPAPGDSCVSLWFVSGSQATVLQVNAATGWIEARGEPVQGPLTTGWITPAYLASVPGTGEPTADTLAWCPAKGSPAPHPSGRLRLATWSLENLGDGSLRYGTRIDLTHNGQTIQLMSVHLKSGCFENASTSSACETLLVQVPVLEGWIDAAAAGPRPFIVPGTSTAGSINRTIGSGPTWMTARPLTRISGR
jgi:hypothetical protein